MAKHRDLEGLLYISAIGASICLLLFVVTCTIIGYEVKDICSDAKAEYKGDCVGSLITMLEDETQSFRERNSAIWALGQLGDSRALPVLDRFYTGEIPEREALSGGISQYELKKAINLASGGLNITTWAWNAD